MSESSKDKTAFYRLIALAVFIVPRKPYLWERVGFNNNEFQRATKGSESDADSIAIQAKEQLQLKYRKKYPRLTFPYLVLDRNLQIIPIVLIDPKKPKEDEEVDRFLDEDEVKLRICELEGKEVPQPEPIQGSLLG